MNNPDRPWTPEELALLAAGLSNAEVSKRTGRSQAAIRGKRQRLAAQVKPTVAMPPLPNVILPAVQSVWLEGVTASPALPHQPGDPAPPTSDGDTYENDQARAREDFWKREHDVLKRKYDKALKEQSAIERLVSVARELAPTSYTSLPPVVRVSEGKGKPQSALLFLSDTHVGKVILPEQTMGFGEYNFEIFLARLKFYEEAVSSILRDHVSTKLDELVIAMGGDMLDGALKHAAEVGQQVTLFQQYFGAGHAFAQFIRNLAPLVPRVRIYCTVGNHTRWADQHKMPTENRYSNLDSFVYSYTQALTRDLPNVDWKLDTQPFALFNVQGFLFHLSHGDQLRGGDRALGIPNHAVGRMVSSTTQLYGKIGTPSPHYYLVGHLHREIVLPHARGAVVVNGGFPGVDNYGLASGFSPVDPKQVFFLVHPKYGKTATYDIELKFAKVDSAPSPLAGRPYAIPGGIL